MFFVPHSSTFVFNSFFFLSFFLFFLLFQFVLFVSFYFFFFIFFHYSFYRNCNFKKKTFWFLFIAQIPFTSFPPNYYKHRKVARMAIEYQVRHGDTEFHRYFHTISVHINVQKYNWNRMKLCVVLSPDIRATSYVYNTLIFTILLFIFKINLRCGLNFLFFVFFFLNKL